MQDFRILEVVSQTRIKGTLREDQYTFSIISRLVLLRMKSVSERSWQRNLKHIFYSVTPPPPGNRFFYGVMWKNIVERLDVAIYIY
jgi:hypothetical protein